MRSTSRGQTGGRHQLTPTIGSAFHTVWGRPKSVLRHLGIDDVRPEIDSARQAPNLPEAQIPEDEATVDASVADVAVNDGPLFGVQLLDPVPQFRERNVNRALDVGLLPLPVLAHIDQDHLLP